MLDKLKEMSISGWQPIGEIISAIFESSNTWFPIISYFVITFFALVLLKLILDKTVSTTSSWTMSLIWSFFKKLILYTIIIGLITIIVISLYFYIESVYTEHQKETTQIETREQSVDYLLL